MRSRRRAAVLHLGLACALALPFDTRAGSAFGIGTPGLLVEGSCSVTVDFDSPVCDGEFAQTLLQPNTTDTLRDSGTDSNGVRGNTNASVALGAAVRMGVLGARAVAGGSSASGLSTSPHVTAIAEASGTARWVDRLTASPAGVAPGTNAMLMLRLPLSGSFDLGPTGTSLPAGVAREFYRANMSFRIRSWDTARPQATDTRNAVGSIEFRISRFQGAQSFFSGVLFEGLTALPAAVTHAVPITIGTPFWLDVRLEAGATTDVSAPDLPIDDPRYAFARTGSASAEFLSTVAWGVPTIVLADGTVVTVPALSSLSGTNYNVPIQSVGDPPIFANGFEP